MGGLSDQLPGIALLLARLYVGYWFIASGIRKIGRGYLYGGALLPQLERFAAGTPHGWYKAWLESVVIAGAGKYWGIDGWWRQQR